MKSMTKHSRRSDHILELEQIELSQKSNASKVNFDKSFDQYPNLKNIQDSKQKVQNMWINEMAQNSPSHDSFSPELRNQHTSKFELPGLLSPSEFDDTTNVQNP